MSGRRKKLPRMVRTEWVLESWKEKTLLDEESLMSRSVLKHERSLTDILAQDLRGDQSRP